jgi:hypothetical protein
LEPEQAVVRLTGSLAAMRCSFVVLAGDDDEEQVRRCVAFAVASERPADRPLPA